jgi:FixJ family two-component response regulator
VLLTDVVMPRLNGRALAERLATARPGLKVLFTSGYPDSAVTHNGEIDVGLSFIAKPYTASALAQKLRHVLEGSE